MTVRPDPRDARRPGLRRFGRGLRLWGLALVVAGGALVPAGSRALARRFLFPTSEIPRCASPDDFVRHLVLARDGVAVRALEIPAPPGARTVVHFHNNRQTVESLADAARTLRARGLGVLLVESRGYGASPGNDPSEEGLYLDAEAALDMLAARGIGGDSVVLWGTSLGTGVAAEMARRGRGSRLVLVSPYTSIPELVTSVVPFAPARALVDDQFDTLAKAGDIRARTLVIHGDADEIVPFWMGERLAGAIRGARLLRVPNGHHGDLFLRDPELVLSEIAAFAS